MSIIVMCMRVLIMGVLVVGVVVMGVGVVVGVAVPLVEGEGVDERPGLPEQGGGHGHRAKHAARVQHRGI
jgi:hypothetical protein